MNYSAISCDIIIALNGEMRCRVRERGFSLIGLLLSVTIVSILLVVALQSYGPVMQGANTGTGKNALGMEMTKVRLRGVYQAEAIYYSLHKKYGTWAELVRDGQIPRGYSDRAMGAGTPFVPGHDIEIKLTPTGFVVIASPNPSAGALEGSPILRIDETGRLEEVQPE